MGSGKSKKARVPVYPAIQGPMVATMVARAQKAAENVNVPTLEQLFPFMANNPFVGMTQGTIPTQNMMGAGRFLGQNTVNMEAMPTNMPVQGYSPMFGYSPMQAQLMSNAMGGGLLAPQFTFNVPTQT